jgi:putative flippase GtrA
MTVDIVIPTYNEEHTLERCILALRDYLTAVPFEARITIADNASTDQTPAVAARLARQYDDVRVIEISRRGRGLALRTAWMRSSADILVYMDVDLSTNLNALLPLVAPLVSGHSDLAIGTRLAPTARVLRGSKREFISRSYNLLLRGALGAGFSDAQCGFKAIRAETARWLVPLVRDDSWFFDTELLVLAERSGLRIHQVPVDWVDDPDSRVDICRTAVDDVKGIARLGWSLARNRVPLLDARFAPTGGNGRLGTQALRFVAVGLVSTFAYALMFLLARTQTNAASANVVALLATSTFNTAANRLWTFGVRGHTRVVRHQAQGMLVLAAGLLVTTLALATAHDVGVSGAGPELGVLTAANVVVTAGRFAAFRWWVFRSPRSVQPCESGSSALPTPLAHDQA